MDIDTSNKSLEEDAVVTDTRPQNEDGSADAHADEDHKATGALAPSNAVAEVQNTNGEATITSQEVAPPNATVASESGDQQMKDAPDSTAEIDQEPMASASNETPSANGAPGANKRASIGNSSKKKTSAVPEHNRKKLNRKKSRPLTHLDAQAGEYYFARMKGHPPWPSIICDEEMLPNSLLETRPVTARLPDGSFKKPEYEDGGKRSHERTFPVMFLHTNEFAWIPNTELTPLEPTSEDVKTPSEKGKSKTLLAAYSKAAEANELQSFKNMLVEHELALQEDLAAQEERAAKKAEKTKRATGRKSMDATADDEEMDIDEEVTEKSKSKKRKKAAEESDADEKPSKTPKTATKLKLSTPKQPPDSSSKKKFQKSKAKPARTTSDEDDKTPLVEEKPPSPAALREMKEKKVLYFRHKLQRGFLSRDYTPKAEEMKPMSDYLEELENLKELEGGIIRATKIHKVLKQMIKLETIPLNEEYNFKERASKLLGKWNDVLSNDAPMEDKSESKAEDQTESKEEPPQVAEKTVGNEKETSANGHITTEPDAELKQKVDVKETKPEAGPNGVDEAASLENEQASASAAQSHSEESKERQASSSTKDVEPPKPSTQELNENISSPEARTEAMDTTG